MEKNVAYTNKNLSLEISTLWEREKQQRVIIERKKLLENSDLKNSSTNKKTVAQRESELYTDLIRSL